MIWVSCGHLFTRQLMEPDKPIHRVQNPQESNRVNTRGSSRVGLRERDIFLLARSLRATTRCFLRAESRHLSDVELKLIPEC